MKKYYYKHFKLIHLYLFALFLLFLFSSVYNPLLIKKSLIQPSVIDIKPYPNKTDLEASKQLIIINNNVVTNLLGHDQNIAPKYKFSQKTSLQPLRHLPNVLIIGVKKCGTRALLEFSRLHPGIRAAGSEIHFFDKYYARGLPWYRRRMPLTWDGQLTMEKTPSYFVTKDVPARVKDMNASMRLIVVVRDPTTRAISDYAQAASKKSRMRRFDELAFRNGTNGPVDTSWAPVRIGLYARYLERWLQCFPLDQFLFISGERMIADPVAEMERLQDFLGLDRIVAEKHFYFNATKGFPCLLKTERRSAPHCLGKTKGRSHPEINPLALQRLRQFYRPFNQKLYQMTGIDFGWA